MKIVVLPGLDGAGGLLGPFCDALPDGFDCQVMRYPVDIVSYEAVIDWLWSQLPSDDFVIIAESFSGPVGVRLASDPPDGLRGVVLVATFATRPRWIPKPLLWLAGLWPFGASVLARLAVPFTMGRWGSPALVRDFVAMMRDLPMATMLQRLAAARQVDVRACVPMVPLRYVRAKHDWLVPARAAAGFKDVAVIDGPHFLLQTRPTQAARIVVAFCAEL